MRNTFHHQLDVLTGDIAALCGRSTGAMRDASEALLRADLALAENVIADRGGIAAAAADVEGAAYRLLALQAPVASDLRAVVTSMQNAADVDRMGALAVHVAEVARRRHPKRAVPVDVSMLIAEMASRAVQLGTSTGGVRPAADPLRAASLRNDDDKLDALHRHLFVVVMDRDWAHGVEAAIDVTLLSRYFERFADHAVEIGRRVVFQHSGSDRMAG